MPTTPRPLGTCSRRDAARAPASRPRGVRAYTRVRRGAAGSLGLHTAAVDPRIEQIEIDDRRGRTQVDSLRKLLRAFAARAQLEIPDLRNAAAEIRPDALIVDINCEGARHAAEASGQPWALYCPYPPPFRSADAPPHGFGFPPARGRLGRSRDRLWWMLADRLVAPELPPLDQLRRGLSLPPLRSFDEQYLKADRFIAFTAEPYEYHRNDWPSEVRLVGPGRWEPTAEALAGENVSMTVSTAAQDPAAFAAPANAHIERFLPHGPILERAACVVSHGGQGITVKALASGVPVCVVPFCRDQFDVARRVEHSGAGVRLHHKRLNAQRLRAAVTTAMSKRPGAERIARAFASAGGAAAAADAVEEILPRMLDRRDSRSERSWPDARGITRTGV